MRLLRYACAGLSLALLLAVTAGEARADNNPLITVNENGQGTLLFPGGGSFTTVGVLTSDPGPGGLASALTYSLLGPPALVAGDLVLLDAGGAISDVIRFNPAGTGTPGYAASLVFYSLPGGGALADTGFPSAFYTNLISFSEGPDGDLFYTPEAGQPGFVAGFSVTYHIISSPDAATPEPATMLLLSTGLAGLAGAVRRRRTRQA